MALMMTGNFTTPVVVLGGSSHGNLGIVRSLGRLGVTVYLVQTEARKPASLSRYCRQSFLWPGTTKDPQRCLGWLLELGERIGSRAFLLPTCDDDAIFAAEHIQSLEKWFIYPRQSAELARSLVSKKEMHFLARKHIVPTPDVEFPASQQDVLAFSRSAKFPVVVKGIDGGRLKAKLGSGVLIAKTPSDLISICAEAGEAELSNLMLQEYIPGGDDCVWMFNGYFDASSECLFGATGQKIRQYPAYTGATSLGVCRHRDLVYQATTRWMKELGYKGILDIGYRFDARDGQYKVLDVNPRIGATFRLFVAENGIDVARAMYLDLTGQAVPQSQVSEGRKWIVEDCDLGSSLRYWRDRRLAFLPWAKSLAGIRETAYFTTDDLQPFWEMCQRSLSIRIRAKNLFATGRSASPFCSSANPGSQPCL